VDEWRERAVTHEIAERDGREPGERVREIVVAMAPASISEPGPDTRLVEDLGYDSLRLLELAMAVETEFSLPPIAADEVATVATIGDAERLLGDGLAGAGR
jgi:acyl carrier protein